ncbi:MAG: hypothetical protein IH865_13410 [Chloroflexi bacterium]|nr:hypothetical protein [Chloroflexota bacterium]
MKVLFAAIAGLVVFVAFASPSQSVGDADVLFVGSGTAAVGGETTVTLGVAKTTGPPNGAWLIDISYDNTIVSATACEPLAGSACSPVFADDMIRSTGASAMGFEAPMDFARITFRCERAGESQLTLRVSVWGDATGFDQEQPELVKGSITCTEASQDGIIVVGSYEAAVGEEVTVVLEAVDIPPPGLGAWDVDITYDTAIVSLAECAPLQGGICDLERREDTVRVAGANAAGLPGTFTLAEIVFACKAVGTTDLEVRLSIFGVFPIGSPEPPGAVSGSLTCVEADEQQPVLPSVGRQPGSPHVTPWLVASMAMAGLALVAAALAFRRLRFA